ncbi:glycosyltransferase family 1 protein [Flavobacterium sp. MDT1-60]|uniref:glycosyltransferase family 4 protein n=1 Tax=Flavobacterium sp. MDT1-60 TaxID=1979344 RepID=UPI00177F5992|nr:glycosyltransferase family 1 protein [Flavobacterium sp. MDT1-60]QOG04127.1 glycosyltransferase family 4 protein [Flavobacterium sp. MDT1-60]
MKIGIDAKWYFEGPASGKMVIRNLVNEICKANSKLNFYIILDKKCENLQLDSENTKVKKVYVWNGNNLLSNVFFVPFVAKKYDLDIVLYQTSVSLFGKHKKIAYIHDLIYISHPQYYTFLERIYLKPLKFLTKFSDFVITVSNSEKNRFQNLAFTNKDIKVLHHGYDSLFKVIDGRDDEDNSEIKSRLQLNEKYILYVGRINTRKNIPNLLKAFQSLEDKQIKLILVGKREWKTDDLNSLLDDPSISDRVILTGSVSNEELSIIYSNAYIFCFPSFEEAFGLPPLEAMASGIPVVVSNSSSLPEVCGDAAIYVNASEPNEIAEAITRLLSDTDLYNKYKQLSVERAKAFSWTNTTQNLIDILEKRYVK